MFKKKRDFTLEKQNGCKDLTIGWNSSPFSLFAEMIEFRKG